MKLHHMLIMLSIATLLISLYNILTLILLRKLGYNVRLIDIGFGLIRKKFKDSGGRSLVVVRYIPIYFRFRGIYRWICRTSTTGMDTKGCYVIDAKGVHDAKQQHLLPKPINRDGEIKSIGRIANPILHVGRAVVLIVTVSVGLWITQDFKVAKIHVANDSGLTYGIADGDILMKANCYEAIIMRGNKLMHVQTNLFDKYSQEYYDKHRQDVEYCNKISYYRDIELNDYTKNVAKYMSNIDGVEAEQITIKNIITMWRFYLHQTKGFWLCLFRYLKSYFILDEEYKKQYLHTKFYPVYCDFGCKFGFCEEGLGRSSIIERLCEVVLLIALKIIFDILTSSVRCIVRVSRRKFGLTIGG